MVLSMWTTSTIEKVAQSSPKGLKWFHVYLIKNKKYVISHVRRAEKEGYRALVLTVDAPYRGFVRSQSFEFPRHLSKPTAVIQNSDNSTPEVVWSNPGMTWNVVQWLRYFFQI